MIDTLEMSGDTGNNQARRRRAGYPSRADLAEALALLERGEGYGPEPANPAVAGPRPTPALQNWLSAHRPLPMLRLDCGRCGYHVDKWAELGGHIIPPRPGHDPQGGLGYTQLVAAGKGPVTSSYTADGRGTFEYTCQRQRCRYSRSLRAETRMSLYLQALLDNSTTVLL